MTRHGALVAAIFVAVCTSRAVLFPASIWEQDEAYLAAAVIEIDLAESAPHPPFFPLWVGLGKVLHLIGLEPATGLMLASAVLGSLAFLPLVALWSRLMKPGLAVVAAALALATPGVWLLAGRAFTGTAATAALVAAVACWTRPGADRGWLAGGSLAAGVAVLIRPHVVVIVAAAAVVVLTDRPARRRWLSVVAPGVIDTVAGFAAFVAAAGGPAAIRSAIARHAALHFGALPEASRSLLDSGLAAVLGHPAVAVVWCALAASGAWLALRSAQHRRAAAVIAVALASAVVVVFGLSNPAHPRYAVPLVLLSSGFVVVALARLLGERIAAVVVALAVAAAAVLVLPVAASYRRLTAPPLEALDLADRLAAGRRGVVVADRRLHAFVVYRETLGRQASPVVFDYLIELGTSPPPPPARSVMVFDDGHDELLVAGETRQTIRCTVPLLRSLSQGRFLDLTVVDGARLVNRSDSDGPFVILD